MQAGTRQGPQRQFLHPANLVVLSTGAFALVLITWLSWFATVDLSLTEPFQEKDPCVPQNMLRVPTIAGFDMAILLHRDIVSASIWDQGFWDINRTAGLADGTNVTIPSGGSFLDLGGNIGYFSLLFGEANYTVYSVEPMALNRRAIEASLCMNPHLRDRIKVIPVALVSPDDVDTHCLIRPVRGNRGNGYLSCGSLWSLGYCGEGCERMPVKTLDALLEELQPPAIDLVKIDIENFECRVLAGGHSLFTRYRPKLVRVETEYSGAACWQAAAEKYGYTTIRLGAETVLVRKPEAAPPASPVPGDEGQTARRIGPRGA